MEVCEQIEDAGGNQAELEGIKRSFYLPCLRETMDAAAAAFRARDAAAARAATARLQYLKRVGDLLGESLEVQ